MPKTVTVSFSYLKILGFLGIKVKNIVVLRLEGTEQL